MAIDWGSFVSGLVLGYLIPSLLADRRKILDARAIPSRARLDAIELWSTENASREAAYRRIVTAVQAGDHVAFIEAFEKVRTPSNVLELHPVIRLAATHSTEIRRLVADLISDESRFVEVADICAGRIGRPGLLESPAFADLKGIHSRMSLSCLSLKEQLRLYAAEYQ